MDEICTFDATHENWCIQQGFDYDSDSDSCTYVEEIISAEAREDAGQGKIIVGISKYDIVFFGLIIIILYYVAIEAGPKRGLFKSKRRRRR